MKLKAVRADVSPNGCQFTGKPFHRWVLSFIDPRPSGLRDLERKCVDCAVQQHAQAVPDEETRDLPKTLWCVGDWTWLPGGLEP